MITINFQKLITNMNIGIVINTSWNIFNFRLGLIKSLIDDGHKVFAIAPKDDYSAHLETFGMTFVDLNLESKSTNPIKDLKLIFELRKIYKLNKLDVVLHYTIKPNIYGTLATMFSTIKTINNVSGLGTTFIRETLMTKLVKWMYKVSFKKANHIFFQNEDDLNLFKKNNLVSNLNVGLLPGSGIDLLKYKYSEKQFDSNSILFLLPCRLLIDKGVGEFIQAVVKIKNEYGEKAIFNVCGIYEPNPNLGFDKEAVSKWVKDGLINYLGHVDNVDELIVDSNVVVLPSYREGTPRVLLEAAALGRPIITTNAPGCKEVVINKGNGLLCEVKDVNSLYYCMKNVLDSTPETLLQMGKRGRELAENRFDEQIVINKYKEVLKTINGIN